MKLRSALLAAALLVPACAGAGEFDAYRIPEHTWRSGSVALAGRYSHDSHTQDAPYSAAGVSSDGASALGLSFARGYDSDRFQHAWSVDARGSLVGSTADERNETLAQAMNSWSGDASGSCRIWGNIRAYPEKRDLGMDLSAFFFASSGESRGRLDQRQFTPPVAGRYETRLSNQGNSYQYSGIARITLGHGIVRDATVVEDVHILESRLLAAGTLSRPLTPAGRARLAELLTVTPSLSFEHDRPERFEWREVERILREDGALSGGSLDAYGVLRAMEPYLSVSSQRRSGHFAGLAATFDHDHQILRTSVPA